MAWASSPWRRALWEAGCRSFFVARPMEGDELRGVLPAKPSSMCSTACFPARPNSMPSNDLRPALISIEEAREWAAFGRVYGRKLPCASMSIPASTAWAFPSREYTALLAETATMEGLNVTLLMSHLACADEATPSPQRCNSARPSTPSARSLPGVPASLANSSGIFLGQGLHP